jgi:hypothetical protein
MSALKIDWEETSGIFRQRVQSHARITTAWSMDQVPDDPSYTRIISLNGIGRVGVGGVTTEDPFSSINVALPFDIASRYVEDCLAKNALIDLTGHNIPSVIARYGNAGPGRHDPRDIHEAAKKTLG